MLLRYSNKNEIKIDFNYLSVNLNSIKILKENKDKIGMDYRKMKMLLNYY